MESPTSTFALLEQARSGCRWMRLARLLWR